MHPTVRAFSERRPRMYGLLSLITAFGLGYWGRRTAAPTLAFVLLMLSAGSGAVGILYITLGWRACRMDNRFVARVNLNKLTWIQALFIIGLGVGLLLLSGLLYRLLR